MRRAFPVGVLIAVGMVLTAFFLSWGTASYTWSEYYRQSSALTPQETQQVVAESVRANGPRISIPLDAWSGTWSLDDPLLPNWLVLAAALWVLALHIVDLFPNTTVPTWIPLLFCGYGLSHLLRIWSHVVPYGSPGIGLVLTSAAYVAMSAVLVRDLLRRSKRELVTAATESLPRPATASTGPRPIPH